MTGQLIAIEGIDASGKTTQAKLLAKALGAEYTFQFGATPTGKVIRDLLLNMENYRPEGRADLDDRTEALLVLADKAQHTAEKVKPDLEAGKTVVTDRFTASTLAYQGYGRDLDLGELRRMLHFATDGIEPDLTLLLDIEPTLRHEFLEPAIDRIESAAAVDQFMQRVRMGYLEIAAQDPGRWVVVDADGSIEEVAARVRAAVDERFSGLTDST